MYVQYSSAIMVTHACQGFTCYTRDTCKLCTRVSCKSFTLYVCTCAILYLHYYVNTAIAISSIMHNPGYNEMALHK